MSNSETLARIAMANLARVDPVPYDPRTGVEYGLVRVKIDSATENQPIPNGNLVASGEGVYEIYSNQLPSVEALVETSTEAELDMVRRDLEYHTAEVAGELPSGAKPNNTRHYQPSFPASFRAVMKRDILPFRSLEVLPAQSAQPKGDRARKG